jgi:hypothetical protein
MTQRLFAGSRWLIFQTASFWGALTVAARATVPALVNADETRMIT